MTSKKITRTRWTCDYCGRKAWTRPRMEQHERGCCFNPQRQCGMHRIALQGTATPTAEALRTAASIGMRELRAAADDCPACILAGIRLLERVEGSTGTPGGDGGFNFMRERELWWRRRNEESDPYA